MDEAPTHLKKAPISEAIIDFRVKARADFDAKEFEQLREVLSSSFPNAARRHEQRAIIGFNHQRGRMSKTNDPELQGWFFKSEDGLNIAQFRIDGFTFNRLKPYTRWETIFPLALDLWQRYLEIAQPIVATRLALRYINRIDLPTGSVDLDELLTESENSKRATEANR